MQIEDYIPKGMENAVRREELCRITGKDDRVNRDAIREARKRGVPIVVSPRGGYYITEDEAEITHLRNEMLSRAMDMLQTASRLKVLIVGRDQERFGGIFNG